MRVPNNNAACLEEKLRQDVFTKRLSDNQVIAPELELARRYDISRTSVRKVLEKLVYEGILYRRQGSGTFVVPEKQRGTDVSVTCQDCSVRQVVFLSMDTVLSEVSFRSQSTYGPVFTGLNHALQPRGFNLLLAHVGLDWRPPACLVRNDISGVIFHGEVNPDFWQQYIRPYPNVGLQYINPTFDCDWVKLDNYNRSYQALAYLQKLGHRNIGFVSNESEMLITRERYQGYLTGLQQLRLPSNPDWEILWQRPRQDGILANEEEIPDYRPYLQKAFQHREKPTAFLCADSWRAICTLTALQKMGLRVPEDISLIGGGNTEENPGTIVDGKRLQMTRFNDRLTDICAVAANVLLEQFSAEKYCQGKTIILRPQLIEGATVEPLAAKQTKT